MNQLKPILLTMLSVCLFSMDMSAIAANQQTDTQQEILLDVLLGAYNGGAQAYANETNTDVPLLSKEELAELEKNLEQLQTLVTDENGQIDLDKVNALLSLASQSDYEVMGLKASSLEKPLEVFHEAAKQGKSWQQTLLALKAQNQPIIDRALADISPSDGGKNIADVLSIVIGAGMAIEELTQDDPSQIKHDEAFDQEINYLKLLAEKDMPTLLHTDVNHQVDALIGRLKIAYADRSVGEQIPASTQSNIDALEYFMGQADGQLTQTQYDQLMQWLNRMDDSYRTVRQHLIDQHDNLVKK